MVENITTIRENETITLTFFNNTGISSVNWYYNVSGANYTVSEDYERAKIFLSNASKDVIVEVEAVGCCFVAGTQVLMADGTTKNIEDVKIGDVVLSYNESIDEYENNVVDGLITNPKTTNLARVKLLDGTSIEMNKYHPIYTEEGWKSLTNYRGLPKLTDNDKVLSVKGEFIEIHSIESWEEETPITTYNLSVSNNHNYFVGETSILVHNAACPT